MINILKGKIQAKLIAITEITAAIAVIILPLYACSETPKPTTDEIKLALEHAMQSNTSNNNQEDDTTLTNRILAVDNANCKQVEQGFQLCEVVYQANYAKNQQPSNYHEKLVFRRVEQGWMIDVVKTSQYCKEK